MSFSLFVTPGELLRLIFAGYVPLASETPTPFSGGSKPSDKGWRWGGHPYPEIRGHGGGGEGAGGLQKGPLP